MSLKVGQLQRGKGDPRRGRVPADHVNRCAFSCPWLLFIILSGTGMRQDCECMLCFDNAAEALQQRPALHMSVVEFVDSLVEQWPLSRLLGCRLMRCNFSVMRRLGDRVLRPFLQVRQPGNTDSDRRLCAICHSRPTADIIRSMRRWSNADGTHLSVWPRLHVPALSVASHRRCFVFCCCMDPLTACAAPDILAAATSRLQKPLLCFAAPTKAVKGC